MSSIIKQTYFKQELIHEAALILTYILIDYKLLVNKVIYNWSYLYVKI